MSRALHPAWGPVEPCVVQGPDEEYTPTGSYKAKSRTVPGLSIVIDPRRANGRCWTVTYTLGGNAWAYEGWSTSVVRALDQAERAFLENLADARLVALRASCAGLYKWMNGAWTHLADGVGWTGDLMEDNHGWGQYVTVHYVGPFPGVGYYWRIAGGGRVEASTTWKGFLDTIPYETLREFNLAEAVPFTG